MKLLTSILTIHWEVTTLDCYNITKDINYKSYLLGYKKVEFNGINFTTLN